MRLTSMLAALLLAVSMPSLSSTDGCSDPTPTPDPTPACSAEVCDGIDNDCNGDIDDGVPVRVSEIDSIILDYDTHRGEIEYIPCGTTGDLKLTSQGLTGITITGAFSAVPAQDGYSTSTVVPFPGKKFRMEWAFELDGQFDSSGHYGDVSKGHGGTFLWPYNAAQVFPAPIGQDEAVLIQTTTVRGIPTGSTAYMSSLPYVRGNLYQFSATVDTFQAPILAGSSDIGNITMRIVPHAKSPTTPPQIVDYAKSYMDWLEANIGDYTLAGPQGVFTLLSVNWCTTESASCPYAGMEEHPVAKVSFTNMDTPDSVTVNGSMTNSQYLSGIGVSAHEMTHGFSIGGLVVRPACIQDYLPFGEGFTSYMSDILRARVDGFHSEADFRLRHQKNVDYYITSKQDVMAWPQAPCTETPGSSPVNYTSGTYDRGALFWEGYAAAVGQAQIFAWFSDIHERASDSPQLYALTGEEMLDDAANFLGVDARDVVVTMTDGTSKSLVDGWLRSVGSRPVE